MALRKSRFITGLILLLAVFLATGSWAQTSRGTVSGTITDATGAVVPNANVQLVHTATNVVRETKSNDVGLYRFDAVALGNYSMRVMASGFATAETKGLEVFANQTTAQDFALKVGTGGETVEVSGAAAAAMLQTEEQLRGANINVKSLTMLPISGQSSLNLLTIVPGVVPDANGVGGGIGAVNGSRVRANNFMIDGADNNDVSVAGQVITITNNDAVQEVSIQTADFSAEFGRSGGAVVNQITKSGTNNLHGTAAWVYRSQRFNASTKSQQIAYANQTAKGILPGNPLWKPVKPAFKEHIPAFTVGGPVYIPGLYDGRNKTFWFVAGQWDHYNSGGVTTSFNNVPTADGIATLTSLAAQCPNAALYLKSLGGMVAGTSTSTQSIAIPTSVYTAGSTCNGTNRAGMTVPVGTASRVDPNNAPSYNLMFRFDHALTNRQNFTARLFETYSTTPNYTTGISRSFDVDATFREINSTITHNYAITNTMTNEFRVNFTRTAYVWTVVDAVGLGALPSFSIASAAGFGTDSAQPQGRTPNTYQVQDTMTKVIGHHQVRFGGEFFRQIAMQIAPMNLRGTLTYSASGSGSTLVTGLANFIDDFSGSGNGRITRAYGDSRYHPNYKSGSVFAQDSWKVTPDLTLNLGVRWDYFGQPANNFKFPVVSLDPAAFTAQRVASDRNNFGPSVGFAWNPKRGFLLGNGKTVIRGGFQISYDRWFNNLFSNMAAGAPNASGNVPVNASTTGRGIASLYATKFPAIQDAGVLTSQDTSSQFTANIRNPYTERWSLGVQRELGAGVIVDVAYVGSASHKLFQQKQLNPNTPALNSSGTAYTAGPRLIPTIGSRSVRDSSANSNYHSLQTEVRKRYSKTPLGALQFGSSWTWAHTMGVVDEVFATYATNATFMTANPLLYNGNRNFDYGNSDNDRRHRWVTTFVWDLRGPKNGILGQAFGGWTVSAIIPLQSKSPFTIFNGNDRDFDGSSADRPDVNNPKAPIDTMAQAVAASVCSTGWQDPNKGCVGASDFHWIYYPSGVLNLNNSNTMHRNTVYSKTGSALVDFNVIKTFTIREGWKLEYRAEIFNLMNHRNFNNIGNISNRNLSTIFNSYSASAGKATSTFLDYNQSSFGNRTMRMQLKLAF